jgi:hypothetical protein
VKSILFPGHTGNCAMKGRLGISDAVRSSLRPWSEQPKLIPSQPPSQRTAEKANSETRVH